MSLLKALGGALLFTLVTASPALAQYGYGGPVVRVRVAPPAPIVETIPVAPSPRHVWTQGHWQWSPAQGRHIWAPGYYQLPARPGQIWVHARWVNQGGEWVYAPGHWGYGRPVYQQPVYQQPQPVYQQPVYEQPQPVYQQPQPVYQQPQPVYEQPQPVYQPQPEVYQASQPIEVEAAPPPPQIEVIPAAPSPNHLWIAGYWGWRDGRHFWYPGRYELRRPGLSWQAPAWGRYGRYWRYSPGRWR
jgi:hypothetical protein